MNEIALFASGSFAKGSCRRPLSALAFSLVAHLGLSRGMALLPQTAPAQEPPTAFEIEMPAPEPPRVATAEPAPVAPEPAARPPSEPPPTKRSPAPQEAPPAPTPATPAEAPPVVAAEPGFLTAGVSTDGMGLPAGQLGTARPATVAPALRAQPPAPPAATRQVSFRDLTEKPRPPRLDEALRRNYPPGARLSGRAGTARVLLSITRSGKVTEVRLVGATAPEFAEACRRTLLGTAWSAPLDLQGRAVGTLLPYECRFRVTP